MKKILSIFIALVLCLSVCVGSVISANEAGPEYSYYGRILGLGDSWLCGVGANPKVVVPVKAAETLGWEYGSLAGAAGGWYTANAVNAIDPEKANNVYDEMVDADTIVIHVGTNDFCGTSHYTSSVKNGSKTFKQLYDALETSYMNKINGMISSIKTANPDALVLLGNMWCSYTNGYTDRLAELEAEGLTDDEINAIYEDTRNYYRALAQKSANEKLAAVAQSEENVVLFDVDGLMGYGEEKGSSTYVSSNRHPNASGYELMAGEVVKLIREFYGQESPTFAHPVTTPSEVTTATTTSTTTTTTTTTTTQKQEQSSSSSSTAEGVAMIVETGKGYTSFVNAFTAAQSGQTVKLLESTSVPKMSEFQKSVIVDLNGYTITATENRLFVIKGTGNKLTIKNGNIVSGNTSYCSIILARAGNCFTVDGVNVTSTANKAGDSNLDAMFNFMTSNTSTERLRYEILNSNITHTGSSYILKYYNSEADNTDIVISNSTIKSAKEPLLAKKGTLTISDSTIETTAERIGSASMFDHYLALKIPSDQMVKGYTNSGESKEFKTEAEIDNFLSGINKKAASGGYSFFKIEFAKAVQEDPTPEVAIAMVQGAQVRFNEVTGMRYKATVDTAAVDEYIALGYTVTMGTLIAPADFYDNYTDLTFDTTQSYLDVVTGGYYNNIEGTIAGSIAEIKEKNYGRNFIARSYVKLAKDGIETVCYATENDNTRSIKYLAQAIINDGNYANESQLAWLNKWAAAADWKA